MYYYFAQINHDDKTERESYQAIKQQLASSEIDGDHHEIDNLAAIKPLVGEALGKGAKTLVAIGGNDCFNALINALAADSDAAETVGGFIPLSGSSMATAQLLGIKSWKDAIAVLTARKLHEFSVISAGRDYVLSQLTLTSSPNESRNDSKIECNFDDQLTIKADCRQIIITNLINQTQPHQKNILIEGVSQADYKTDSRQPFINLPYLKSSPKKDNQVIFRLLANALEIRAEGAKLVGYGKPVETIKIGHKIKPVKVIVKKHRVN